jgi:hypothetical protein
MLCATQERYALRHRKGVTATLEEREHSPVSILQFQTGKRLDIFLPLGGAAPLALR